MIEPPTGTRRFYQDVSTAGVSLPWAAETINAETPSHLIGALHDCIDTPNPYCLVRNVCEL
jgi:hypothetical protein